MRKFTITIEVEQIDLHEDNPFIAKGLLLEKKKKLEEQREKRNKAVRDVHINVLKDIKLNLIKKLKEGKIPHHYNHVLSVGDIIVKQKHSEFWIMLFGKTLAVRLTPLSIKDEYTGEYKLSFSTTTNPEQVKFGNSRGYKVFNDVKELEYELLNMIDV